MNGAGPGEEEQNRQERLHFLEVCWSCLDYRKDAEREVLRIQRSIANLDPEDLALWGTPDQQEWLNCIRMGTEANALFLERLPVPDVCGALETEEHLKAARQIPPE